MFIPIHDINPLRRIETPIVTYALIFACTAIFVVFQSGYFVEANRASIAGFSMIPAELRLNVGLRNQFYVIPESLTVVTYMFLHGGWMHLIGNMLFLWVFGDNVEDAMGHFRFLVFYLAAGVAGGLAHMLSAPNSTIPLVGASGAIAGVVAAYLILHPRVKIWVLVLARFPVKITAMWVLSAWAVFQVVMLLVASDHTTAWWAHIGGFVAGAVLVPFMRKPGVPLFDQDLPAEPPPDLRTS